MHFEAGARLFIILELLSVDAPITFSTLDVVFLVFLKMSCFQ